MPEFATVGVIAKRGDDAVQPVLTQLLDLLGERGIAVKVASKTAEGLDLPGTTLSEVTDLAANTDLVIVIGGDGTLLEAGRVVAEHEVPLLGINMGRLGFMVDVLPKAMAESLDRVLSGDYVEDHRMLLECRLADDNSEQGPWLAINDVVLRNKDTSRVIDFDTRLGEQFISRHRADGMIVATPTGSTAYALSGGGPVMHPGLDALALVPICPHTLSDRPLVIAADDRVEIVYGPSNKSEGLLSCDGQVNLPVKPGDRVIVTRATRRLTLLHPPEYDYFGLLRSKLSWGRERTSK